MAFCSNCGMEVFEGTKFCPNCGTQIGTSGVVQANNNASDVQNNTYQQTRYVPPQPMPEKPKSKIHRFAKLYGIVLFILAIIDYNSAPPILTILLSVIIIAGAIFCLRKKCKLKVFSILALIIAAFCLVSGVDLACKYGLTSMPSSKSEQSNTAVQTSGVDPNLKAFLDDYEEFVDQYVDFMKKYNSDPSNMVSMLGEYGEMMQKYTDFADDLNKYDSDNMSAADYKYYIEVTTRCSQKMLEAY